MKTRKSTKDLKNGCEVVSKHNYKTKQIKAINPKDMSNQDSYRDNHNIGRRTSNSNVVTYSLNSHLFFDVYAKFDQNNVSRLSSPTKSPRKTPNKSSPSPIKSSKSSVAPSSLMDSNMNSNGSLPNPNIVSPLKSKYRSRTSSITPIIHTKHSNYLEPCQTFQPILDSTTLFNKHSPTTKSVTKTVRKVRRRGSKKLCKNFRKNNKNQEPINSEVISANQNQALDKSSRSSIKDPLLLIKNKESSPDTVVMNNGQKMLIDDGSDSSNLINRCSHEGREIMVDIGPDVRLEKVDVISKTIEKVLLDTMKDAEENKLQKDKTESLKKKKKRNLKEGKEGSSMKEMEGEMFKSENEECSKEEKDGILPRKKEKKDITKQDKNELFLKVKEERLMKEKDDFFKSEMEICSKNDKEKVLKKNELLPRNKEKRKSLLEDTDEVLQKDNYECSKKLNGKSMKNKKEKIVKKGNEECFVKKDVNEISRQDKIECKVKEMEEFVKEDSEKGLKKDFEEVLNEGKEEYFEKESVESFKKVPEVKNKENNERPLTSVTSSKTISKKVSSCFFDITSSGSQRERERLSLPTHSRPKKTTVHKDHGKKVKTENVPKKMVKNEEEMKETSMEMDDNAETLWQWDGDGEEKLIQLELTGAMVTRMCYPAIRHTSDDVIIRVMDSVLIRSGDQDPYLAKITAFFFDQETDKKMMALWWYYRPEQTSQGRQTWHTDADVYASKHLDTNSLDCIEDKAFVLPIELYGRFLSSQKRQNLSTRQGLTARMVPLMMDDIIVSDPDESKTLTIELTMDMLASNVYYAQNTMTSFPPEMTESNVFVCRGIYDIRHHKITGSILPLILSPTHHCEDTLERCVSVGSAMSISSCDSELGPSAPCRSLFTMVTHHPPPPPPPPPAAASSLSSLSLSSHHPPSPSSISLPPPPITNSVLPSIASFTIRSQKTQHKLLSSAINGKLVSFFPLQHNGH